MSKNNIELDCKNCSSRGGSVFCGLEGEALGELNLSKSCGQFKKGTVVFNEGQNPYGLYCINKGQVKVYQTGNEGKDQIVRLAKEGDILGYRSLLSGEKYSCSAETISDSSICFVPKDTFMNLVNHNNSLSLEVMKLLSKDLKKAEHTITDLAQKPVRERLAQAILFLKEVYGFEEDGITLNVTLSREDIANIVGTATETAIRLVSEFKGEGLLGQLGKKLQILDLNALIDIANLED